jgi:hypothetical protein
MKLDPRGMAQFAERQRFPPPQELSGNADMKDVASSTGLQPVTGPPKQVFRFVARQPILNREQVFGHELLFRDGIENFFRATDAEAAARSTLDSTLLMGFDVLCDGHRVFINCRAISSSRMASPCCLPTKPWLKSWSTSNRTIWSSRPASDSRWRGTPSRSMIT